MPAYSSSLRLVQPVSGEYPGTWGTQVNDGITALVDTAIAGTASITVAGSDITLTTANGAADQARSMIINLTGSPTAARNIICPAVSKLYVVSNNISTGHYVTFKTSAGTGVVIPNGETKIVRCDGTNVVNALTADTVSIVDFGVSLNSTADQTTNIQAAIDAVSAAGGGDLYVPAQTGGAAFYITNATALAMKSNVRLVGQSRATSILRMFNTTTAATMINVDGVSNVTFSNLTFDLNNASFVSGGVTGSVAITLKTTSAVANNFSVQYCDFVNGKARPYIDYIASTAFASRGFEVLYCSFIGSATLVPATIPAVQTSAGIRVLAGTGCGDFQITGNTSKYCGRFIQIRHSTTQAVDQFDSVVVSDNICTDILDDPNVSTSPYELFCITGLTVTGNTIRTGGRGYNATLVKAASFTGNVAYDQTRYFMEIQTVDGITISGNTAYNCKTFINDTSPSTTSKNVNIVGNSIIGGNIGEVNYDAYTYLPSIAFITTSTYANWRIADNIFSGGQYLSSYIALAGTSWTNAIIENNLFLQDDATTYPVAIQTTQTTCTYTDIIIRNNTIKRTANITNSSIGFIRTGTCTNGSAVITGITAPQASTVTASATAALRAGQAVIGTGWGAGVTILTVDSATQVTVTGGTFGGTTGSVSLTFVDQGTFAFLQIAANVPATNILVERNTVIWSGSDARQSPANTGVIGIGSFTSAAANNTKAIFRDNKISGAFTGGTGSNFAAVRLPFTAGDTVYRNNDLTGVTAGSEALDAAIVYRRTKREFEGTASPTTGTYIVGDRVWNSAPAVGQPKSWVCTVAGTPGTWVSEGNL